MFINCIWINLISIAYIISVNCNIIQFYYMAKPIIKIDMHCVYNVSQIIDSEWEKIFGLIWEIFLKLK